MKHYLTIITLRVAAIGDKFLICLELIISDGFSFILRTTLIGIVEVVAYQGICFRHIYVSTAKLHISCEKCKLNQPFFAQSIEYQLFSIF